MRSIDTAVRLARIVAALSGVVTVALWVTFILLLTSGTVEGGRLSAMFYALVFAVWPAAAVASAAAVALVRSRPGLSAALLVFVALALLVPVVLAAVIPLAGAVLALIARKPDLPDDLWSSEPAAQA